MSRSNVELTQEVERLEDPNDGEKVFYRISLSPRPSRKFIEALYDFWNHPTINPSRDRRELLCDYAGNLLIRTDWSDDADDLLALLQDALAHLNGAEPIPG